MVFGLGLGAVIGAGMGAFLSKQVPSFLNATALYCSPTALNIAENGVVAPLNVQWKAEQVQSIRLVRDEKNSQKASLEFTSTGLPPLVIAAGERLCDIEWVVQVLELARKEPIKTLSTANTTPVPARTSPPSGGPSRQ